MANNNYERYTTTIFLNDEQAQDKIDNLNKKIEVFRKAKEAALKKGGKEGNSEWKQAEKEIKAASAELKKLSTTSQQVNKVLGDLSKATPKELKQTISAINKELFNGNVRRGTEEWRELQYQLKRCRSELASIEAENKAANPGGFFSRTAKALNDNWGAITQMLGSLTTLTLTIRQATQSYADMEESMANVRKYTGQTDEEIHSMNEEFKKLDTRTSREQLNELAGAAGRLGIQSHDGIMEFVDAADKINVALGDDLGKGAVDKIGKLAMAFGEDDKMGLRGAMLATGSAINELSANSSANAGYLVEFAARLGGVGKQAGLTQTQIMGLGSVMDENMLQDEMASTALSQLITKMVTDTETFARLANKPLDDFKRMVKEDMNGALLSFFEAMRAKGGFTEIAPMFEQMGLNGQRASSVLSTFANKLDDVRKNQQTANDAYIEATSVMEEYDVQNNTVQASIDKAKKKFHDLVVELGEKLNPVVKYAINSSSLLVKGLSALVNFVTGHMVLIATLTAALVALNAQKLYNISLTKLQILWNRKLKVALVELFNVIKKNPYTLLATAAAAFVAITIDALRNTNKSKEATTALAKANKKAAETYTEESAKVEMLNKMVHNNSLSYELRKQKLDELKQIVPDYLADLDKEKGLVDDNTDAITKYLTQLERQIKLKAAQEELENAYRKKRQLEKSQKAASDEVKDANMDLSASRFAANQRAQSLGTKGAKIFATGLDVATQQAESKLSVAEKKLSKVNQEVAQNKKDIDDLNKEIAKTSKGLTTTTANGNGGNGGNGNGGGNTNTNTGGSSITTNKPVEAIPDEELTKLAYQYSQRNITYQEFLNKRKELTRKYITDKEKQDDAITKLNEEEIEQQRVAQAALLKAQYYDPNSKIYQNEAALNEALYENDMDALAARIAVQKEGSAEWIRLMAERGQKEADQAIQSKQDLHNQLDEMRRTYNEASAEEQMKAELDALEKIKAVIPMKVEEIEQLKQAIRNKYANKTEEPTTSQKADDIIKGAETDVSFGDDYGVSAIANIFQIVKARHEANEQLKAEYGEDYQNSAEYNEKKKQNNQEMFNELVRAANAAYSGINNILSAASSYAQACSDYETAKIEADYDKQITAAGNNTKKKEKLEKKKDEALAAAKTKANKKAMKIEIAQAYASTAMAAINSYASASKVNWVLGAVAAAMATAAGMMQIATIKKQHQAEQLGYYEGGFTGGSSYRKEAGVVHQGEFVANHQAVGNSSILPALQLIDYAQKHNTVSSLTGEDVSRALGQGAASPIVAAPIVNVNTPDNGTAETMSEVKKTMQTLNDRLQSPIQAHISMDELDREQRKYKRLNS